MDKVPACLSYLRALECPTVTVTHKEAGAVYVHHELAASALAGTTVVLYQRPGQDHSRYRLWHCGMSTCDYGLDRDQEE